MSEAASATTHPEPSGPIPPRSRHRWHLGGIALTVVAGPVSFLAMTIPASKLAEVSPTTPQALAALTPSLASWTALGLASLILIATCWLGARSSVAAATSGGFWLACGLLAEFGSGVVDWLANLLPQALLGSQPRLGAHLLLDSGGVLLIGASLTGAAVAASAARRYGRWMEQVEHHRLESGQVTIPPRNRIAAHVTAPIIGAAISIISVALANRVAADSLLDGATGTDRVLLLGTALTVLLLGCLGALSSLGPAVSAGFWLASFIQVALTSTDESFVTALGAGVVGLIEPWGAALARSGADAIGTTLAIAATLTGAAIGAHLARRDGRMTQRREFELS